MVRVWLPVIFTLANGSAVGVRMTGNDINFVLVKRLVRAQQRSTDGDIDLEAGVIGRSAVGAGRIGFSLLHDDNGDAGLRDVVAGIPGRDGMPPDRPVTGDGQAGADIAATIALHRWAARHGRAVEQEVDGRG